MVSGREKCMRFSVSRFENDWCIQNGRRQEGGVLEDAEDNRELRTEV